MSETRKTQMKYNKSQSYDAIVSSGSMYLRIIHALPASRYVTQSNCILLEFMAMHLMLV